MPEPRECVTLMYIYIIILSLNTYSNVTYLTEFSACNFFHFLKKQTKKHKFLHGASCQYPHDSLAGLEPLAPSRSLGPLELTE